jgi:hypothetical protein
MIVVAVRGKWCLPWWCRLGIKYLCVHVNVGLWVGVYVDSLLAVCENC